MGEDRHVFIKIVIPILFGNFKGWNLDSDWNTKEILGLRLYKFFF